jgi:hypothetical protein
MSEELDRQAILDDEHLKLLSWGYMISAAIAGLFSIFGLAYVGIGLIMSFALAHAPAAANKANQPPPAFVGWIFAGVGLMLFVVMIAVGFLKYWAGRCIKQRKSRSYCMVIAALGCLEMPYGTALGVLTFIVLGRPSVMKQFASKPR